MKKSEATISVHKPSVNEKLFFLLSGAIVSVPLTLFVEQNFGYPLLAGLSSFDVTLITVAVFAPFVEEFSKVFPLFYRHGETQRSIFNLALFVGLGFGIVEFFTYVVAFGPQVIPARLSGLVFHPASASISAYGISTKRPLPFYLAAVGIHFANNFFAVFAPGVVPSSVIVLAVTLFASWQLHDKTKEKFIQSENCTCSD
jgi:RsiW-degrading membrane proteinase PrsW (M82 family)